METHLIEKINGWQLFAIIVLFNIGSAVVIGVGLDAGKDAWIAVLVATMIGVALIRVYVFILSTNNGKTLFEVFEVLFGRIIAICISYAYVTYFFYIAARVLRDFMELLITNILPFTPIEILALTFMLAVAYTVYLGPEVLVRVGEIFLPHLLLFLLLISVFLLAMGDIDPNKVRPVLTEGIQPILGTVFPQLVGFPFGEAIVLTCLITITSTQHLPKICCGAVVVSGLILAYHVGLIISVLGIDITERVTFPLLSATRHISLFRFIERLDALVVFIMMIGIFIKVSVFFYGGLKGLEYIHKRPFRYYALPVSATIALIGVLMSSNFAEHIQEGLIFVPYYLHIPFQLAIPGLIALILVMKKFKKRRIEQK
ncbi:MAG: spore germination protein [Bacillaceae bacterium]|nr:spore germination protein [Bacillaceae bacterium]